MKKRFALCLLILSLTAVLCGCGGQTPGAETEAASVPTEATATVAAAETAAKETEPTETIPPETEPSFVTANGIPYDSRLGAPVLGEEATTQLAGRDPASGPEQITNVGDAIYYIQAANIGDYTTFHMTFLRLLAYDYDEVGIIELSSDDSCNFYAYIKQDGMYYLVDPIIIPWVGMPYFNTDLDALCEEMMVTCTDTRFGEPMMRCGHMPVYSDELRNADGIPYASVLGEPVLGKAAAAQLAKAGDYAAAAEQITNVGDAIYFMEAVTLPQRNDTLMLACNLFAYLLGDNYDEVGLISLDSCYGFVYIRQDGVYYQFDPWSMYTGGVGFLISGPASDSDLDRLCEKMLASCSYIRHDDSLEFYSYTPAYSDTLINIEGIPYASVLGEPVLGQAAAAQLAKAGDLAAAAEQITNVGDAIYFLRAADIPDDPVTIFAGLIGDNYEEVGVINLVTTTSECSFVYILQDGVYHKVNPWNMGHDSSAVAVSPSGPLSHTDLETLCEKTLACCVEIEQSDPIKVYTLQQQYVNKTPTTKVEAVTAYLTTSQYTMEQIAAWVAEGLTLEQWAEKIKVPADAFQLLGAIGYREQNSNFGDNIHFVDRTTDIGWLGIIDPHEVFAHRYGYCGGTSRLMNFLLAGDMDEQGYVEYSTIEGGHIFNYFVYDGVYVVCDFVRQFLGCFPNTRGYVEYAGTDLQDFGNRYLNQSTFSPKFFDPDSAYYLFGLYLYPQEGFVLPSGSDRGIRTAASIGRGRILPEQYKDIFVILYEDENNPFRFYPIPPEEQWPDTIK